MYDQGYKSKIQKSKRRMITIYLVMILSVGSIFLFTSINFSSLKISRDKVNEWVIGGIPAPIIFDVLTDIDTLAILLWGSSVDFRNRLQETGIEAKIKNYYRPYFANEIELETHIDQLFYNASGYYNLDEYTVSEEGNLIRQEEENTVQRPQNSQGLYFDLIKNQPRLPNVGSQTPNVSSQAPNDRPQNSSSSRGLYDTIRPTRSY